ncbi:hypothetical protein BJ912DRAFT_847098, partial [Pholiota molesta]
KIYQWLSAPDSSKNYNDAQMMHEGTCSWFLDGERFREFQEKADFLWIKGKAGSGKTILCSSVIEKIDQLHKEIPSITFAYFFFDGRDEQKDLQLHDKLIRSLILQLSRQCDGIPATLVELHGGGYQQPSTKSLEHVLYDIISGMPSVYIIIDSLDECAERKDMLEWITGVVSRKISTLHMVVVSRPERDIEDAFQLLDAHCCIDLAKESESDIMMYLEQQLSVLQKWDEETRNIVKLTLAERSEGMFRWVALQITDLQECPDQESVMAQLKNLPTGLYKTYNRILLKVSKPGRNDTKTFLRWLCFSVHPMTLAEIAEAVMVDLDAKDGPQYTPSRRYFDKKDVLNRCSGLIIESEGTMKLAHFSVKEYLLSDLAESPGPLLNFHLTTAELCHSLISQTCLAYLLQFDADDSVDSDIAVSHPLAPYAAEHWILHAKTGGIDSYESPVSVSVQAIWGEKPDRTGLQNTNLDYPYKVRGRRDTAPPLYYASLAGLQQLCLHLLEKEGVNAQGGVYGNALQAASYQGHKAIVNALLKKGADPNVQGGEYSNALYAASYRGHEATVKVLLEKGADLDAQGGFYHNALCAALSNEYEAIVEMLLKKGADPNAQGGMYGNALCMAPNRGQTVMVKVLLEKGADPNAQGGRYGNALQAASNQGHEAIMKMLMETGANPNAQGGYYGSSLQAASFQGYEAIVEILLEKGTDPNAQGGYYGSPLQAASFQGYEAIVEILLEKGADPNAQGGNYGNGHQEMCGKLRVATVRDRATHRCLCVVCACECVRCAGLCVVCAGRSANVPVRLGEIYRGFACGVDIISSCRTKSRLSVSWPWGI